MNNVPLGVYVPGNSVIHRCPPVIKLVVLLIFVLGTASLIRNTIPASLSVSIPLIGMAIARIPPRLLFGQVGPPLLILIPLALFQWWAADGQAAAVMLLTVLAAIAAAVLVTLTTRVEAMMDAFTQMLGPLSRIGLPVNTIVLAMTLTIRLLPLMMSTVQEVLEARKARGASFSLTAFGTPVVIRSIRRAQAIGEALAARGVGD